MKKHTAWHVYALVDPRTSGVRYIGFSYNVTKRFHEHINDNKRDKNPHKQRWIAHLLLEGFLPICWILETGIGSHWEEAEQFWIKHYRQLGAPLTNLTAGGDALYGYQLTAQARANMSKAKKGKPLSPKALAAVRLFHAAQKGIKRLPDVGQKVSAKRKGHLVSEATRAKIRQSLKASAYTHSAETRARIAEAQRGRHHSALAKQRMSASKTGTKPAPQTIAASVASRQGKPLSLSHRQAIQEHVRHPQRCGKCGNYGHKRRTCPERPLPENTTEGPISL